MVHQVITDPNLDQLSSAEEIHSDKGYEVSTHEKQAEFAKKRDDSLEEYRKQAQELWSDSCTTPRKKWA